MLFIIIFKSLLKQLNFNLIDSTNLYRKFSFQASSPRIFFKIRASYASTCRWRRFRVIANRLYAHTSRNLSPSPPVLQSPATRKRSWPSSRETLRIASSLVLLWIPAVEESEKLVLPSRELAYSRFLTRNLFVPSKNREKIVDNDAMKVQVTKVTCRRVRYRV